MAIKKINEPKIELSLDAMKEIYKEQEEIISGVMKYDLPDELDDVSHPLTFGEKKKLSKHNLKKIDAMDDDEFDTLLNDFLDMRGVENIDDLSYSDLQMWLRRVVITTFNTKVIATKK